MFDVVFDEASDTVGFVTLDVIRLFLLEDKPCKGVYVMQILNVKETEFCAF